MFPQVTYVLHIILRYEIERALMDGSLQVAVSGGRRSGSEWKRTAHGDLVTCLGTAVLDRQSALHACASV